MAESLYAIDGHYQIYRSYYAPFAPLTAPSGEPTKATHAFCGMLFNLIRVRRPDYLVMVMDTSDETVFRRDLYPEYKANREPPPEDFAPQFDRIVSIVKAMGIPILRLPGFEADDLLATIAAQLADRDIDVFLVSKDKDLEQLITSHVRLLDLGKDLVIDAEKLLETKGYAPDQVIDIQTLAGDAVDNIPGIKGVGVKTAAKLVHQYGSADAVIANAANLTPKLGERVREFADRIELTRQLVTLRRDVPIEFDLQACKFTAVPVDAVRPIFEELAFGRLTDQLDALAGGASPSADRVVHESATPESTAEYTMVDTPEALDKLVEALADQGRFAFDTETTGLNPVAAELVGISISWRAGSGYYIPIRAAVGRTLPIEPVVQKLSPIFADPKRIKCGHNLKFDILVLRQVGLRVVGPWFDTMVASFVLDPQRRTHRLDSLVSEVLDHSMIPISDLIGKGKSLITIDQIDSGRVGQYASEDADYTWRLFEHFEPRIASAPVRSLFENVEMPLVEVLAQLQHNGVALDTDVLRDMSKTMARRMHTLTAEIHQAAERTFNIDSPKQLAEVLFDEQGLEVVRKTKTGRSTDAETLAALAATTTNRIPALVLEYRELSKLKGTYVDTLPGMICKKTGRIHASFHQTGAVTGRLSSSDPNMQNIPVRTEMGRRIRAAFVASKPDLVLLTADYSQIELRVLAHFCGDELLRRAFEENRDIHAFVAAQINGVDLADVTKEQRSAAKAVNFGIIYGQTPFGLSRALGIPIVQAKAFIDTYFLRYPGIRLFIDRCIAEGKKNGFVETLLGRRRPVEELRSRNRQQVAMGERIAVNTVIQGSAADLIKRAMIDIHEIIETEKHPSKMLIQVHDELVFEVPANAVEAEAEMIRERMCSAIKLDVPLAVDINWGRNWLEGK